MGGVGSLAACMLLQSIAMGLQLLKEKSENGINPLMAIRPKHCPCGYDAEAM